VASEFSEIEEFFEKQSKFFMIRELLLRENTGSSMCLLFAVGIMPLYPNPLM